MTEMIQRSDTFGKQDAGLALPLPAGFAVSDLPGEEAGYAAGRNSPEIRVSVNAMADIVKARQAGRLMSQQLGFSGCQTTLIVTVISELARNILLYAQSGEIVIGMAANEGHTGLLVSAIDHGPGIDNMEVVLASGYSTSGGVGLGLFGVRQITDEFGIVSEKGVGTRVMAAIWLNKAGSNDPG